MKKNLRRYGRCAYNPCGTLEDTDRCVERIYRERSLVSAQCSRYRGHGKGGEYCKQHAKIIAKYEKESHKGLDNEAS